MATDLRRRAGLRIADDVGRTQLWNRGPMLTGSQRLGILGESLAERWMRQRGWQVVARRFRVGHRDIDLIVQRAHTVAFVEIKTRRRSGFGGPVSAVSARKRRHLSHAATIWIDRHGAPGLEYRFDVLGVLVGCGRIRIAHVENAFGMWQGG